jgi:hypothetical protein
MIVENRTGGQRGQRKMNPRGKGGEKRKREKLYRAEKFSLLVLVPVFTSHPPLLLFLPFCINFLLFENQFHLLFHIFFLNSHRQPLHPPKNHQVHRLISLRGGVHTFQGVCAILLRLYFYGASKKSLHKPGPLLEIYYFTLVMVLIIIHNFMFTASI